MFLLLRYTLYLHFGMADAILRQGKETNNDDDITSVRSESSTNNGVEESENTSDF